MLEHVQQMEIRDAHLKRLFETYASFPDCSVKDIKRAMRDVYGVASIAKLTQPQRQEMFSFYADLVFSYRRNNEIH